MEILADIIKWFCLFAGALFILIGGIGILRFPDLFTRFHAASVTDTLGAGFLLIGLMIEGGFTLVTVKLIMILLFLMITSPSATHALAKAAIHGGHKPAVDKQEDKSSKP